MGARIRIAEMNEVTPGSGLAVEITGRRIAIYNVDEACFALKNCGSVESSPGKA